jgi:hypothetical protein
MGDAAIRRSFAARSRTWSRAGRPIAEVAEALGISAQTISTWRRRAASTRGCSRA